MILVKFRFSSLCTMLLALLLPHASQALSCATPMPADFDLVFLGTVLDVRTNVAQTNPETQNRVAWFRIVSLYKGQIDKTEIPLSYQYIEPWGPDFKPGENVWIYAHKQQDTGDYTFGLCDYGVSPTSP